MERNIFSNCITDIPLKKLFYLVLSALILLSFSETNAGCGGADNTNAQYWSPPGEGLNKRSLTRTFKQMMNTSLNISRYNKKSSNMKITMDEAPVITYEDMIAAYDPRNELQYFYSPDDSVYNMNLGRADKINAQHWVMPACILTNPDIGEGIAIETSPYYSNFTYATHCKKYSYPDTKEEYYEYYEFSDEDIWLVGSVYHDIQNNEVEIDSTEFMMAVLDFDINTKFVAADSEDVNGVTTVYDEKISVEGFGTLTTPDGTFDVLKIKNDYTKKSYKGDELIKIISQPVVTFISKDGTMLNMDLEENAQTTGEAKVLSMEYLNIKKYTGVDRKDNTAPTQYALFRNYPNPFNPTTTIKFSIPHQENVIIKVYDNLGVEVKTLLNETQNAGTYEVEFDEINLASGIYFYQIIAGSYSEAKKMMLLR